MSRQIPKSSKNYDITEDDIHQPFQSLMEESNKTQEKCNIKTSIGIGQVEVSEIVPESVNVQTVDIKELASHQEQCPETQAALQGKHRKGVKFALVTFDDCKIVCEVTHNKARPLLPKSLR